MREENEARPTDSAPGLILWVTTPMPSPFGGMQTHSKFFFESMTLRNWRVLPIRGRISPGWRPPPAPSLPVPTLALVESWSWTAITPRLRRAWPGVPIVVRSGGDDVLVALATAKAELDAPAYDTWLRTTAASVDLVIANSHYSAGRLAEGDLGSIASEVVTGGASEPRNPHLIPNEPPVIMASGRFVYEKGFIDCIEVVARVQQSTDVTLLIAGDGELRQQLEELAAERLRPGSWRFTGALTHDESLEAISQADVFLSMAKGLRVETDSSTYVHAEAMGRAICEALVAGVPVVATAVGGVPELFGDGGGTLVAEADFDAAAAAVITHLAQGHIDDETVSVLRNRLGWEAVGSRYEELFLRLSHDAPA